MLVTHITTAHSTTQELIQNDDMIHLGKLITTEAEKCLFTSMLEP